MIKNNLQYKYARNKLHEFEKDLRTIHEKYSSDKNKRTLLSQGYSEHIAQLKAEIVNYFSGYTGLVIGVLISVRKNLMEFGK